MAFEYPTSTGIIELVQVRERWLLRCAGRSRGAWPSAEAAATAVAGHKTGLYEWDRRHEPVSAELLDWRPRGDSL
jgi:hypothetical protein